MGGVRRLSVAIDGDDAASPPPPLGPIGVLVAADDAFAEHASSVLDKDSRFAVCAQPTNAAEAVRAAIAMQPEIVLMSVDLEGGGIAAAREILSRLPWLTLVMVGENGDDLFPALRAGAEGYLLRDMNLERLPQTLWEAATAHSVALPRALMQEILKRFRDPAALRRTLAEADGEPLTSREWQILSLLRNGLSTAQVSQRLSISVATVRSHRRRIRHKLHSADAAA